ncbi:hypothetical protein ACIQM4_08185 [Streptomyces sp. NPDC091272]|uniref:hypothetical protein n=1 Tax=Streptomyces sp. NPDC091272 TaxID=3365981 RepID=UPI003814C253
METGRTDQHHTSDSPSPQDTTPQPNQTTPNPAKTTPPATPPHPDAPTSPGPAKKTPTDSPRPAPAQSPSAPAPPGPAKKSWPKVVPHQASPTTAQPPAGSHHTRPLRVPARPGVRRPEEAPAPPRHNQHRQHRQHRQQSEEPAAPDPAELLTADPEALRAVRRGRATGFATGVLHTLGFTLLTVYEYFRTAAGSLSDAQRAAGGPDSLREIAGMQADLARESWYGAFGDLARLVTFDQPRAALWSAVFVAVLVRLNRSGPPRVQLGLSVVSAGYCALLAVLWFPFLYAVGSVAFLALAGAGALLWAATRR